jgi:hypothetical protein
MFRFAIPACLSLALVINGSSSIPAAAPAQAADSAKAAQNPLEIPADTPILARLTTEVNLKKCQLGDRVEAQVTHDIKVGRQTVIKRGALVVGKVTKLQATPDSSGIYKIGILFDTVEQKNSPPASLPLEVQALAPPTTEGPDDARDTRGMAQTNIDAGVKGHLGSPGELTDNSRGPISIPGLELGTEIAQGVHTTILSSSKDNIRLTKDSQVVFKVVSP